MSERDGYIFGVPCWVDTSQFDPDAAAEFYGGLFGWELDDAMPAGSAGQVSDRQPPWRRCDGSRYLSSREGDHDARTPR